MKPAPVALLPLLLLPSPILAQTPRGATLPIGSRVKIEDQSGPSVEGTLVAWRGDTLLVQPESRSDTVRVTAANLKKLRVVESPGLWSYTSASKINFYFSTGMPRPRDFT